MCRRGGGDDGFLHVGKGGGPCSEFRRYGVAELGGGGGAGLEKPAYGALSS